MNILFVCSRNKWRSPTAEFIYKKHPNIQVRSAGTSDAANTRLTAKMISWADVIFVMEFKHKKRIIEKFRTDLEQREIIVLDIPDEYNFMDPVLIEEIKIKTDPYLIPLNS